MSYIASSLVTVPSAGFDWYVYFVESQFNDPLKAQVRDNFSALGRAVGRKTLVVRGFDERTMADEVVEAAALYDEKFAMIEPPTLILTNRPIQELHTSAERPGAKLISFNLRGVVSLPDLLERI